MRDLPLMDFDQLPDEDNAHQVVVTQEMAGRRLDAVLAGVLTDFSRVRIKELMLAGALSVDGAVVTDPSRKVRAEEILELLAPPPVDATPQAEAIPLDILYEDEALIVINKAAGMVVHPAPGNFSGTLVNALLHHCGDTLAGIGGVKRPGIVHRLDKETSGVMVAAKSDKAMAGLQAQFADHGRTGPLVRAYLALVWGRMETYRGTVDAPLGRDANARLKQAVRKDGREAITHYDVIDRFGDDGWDISAVRCQLETGRTHQIRVHMAHIGHPIVADPVYSSGFATKAKRLPENLQDLIRDLGRQALHAAVLGFEHPVTGEEMKFEAALPSDFENLVSALAPFRLAISGGAHQK